MQQNWINVNGVPFRLLSSDTLRAFHRWMEREQFREEERASVQFYSDMYQAVWDKASASYRQPSHVSEAQSLTDRDKQMLQSLRIRWE
jgi:hypothetical protein